MHSLTSKQQHQVEALRRLEAALLEKEEALQKREEALRKARAEVTEQVSSITLPLLSFPFLALMDLGLSLLADCSIQVDC